MKKRKYGSLTIQEISRIAKQFNSFTDFYKGDRTAYYRAKKLKILDTLFPNRFKRARARKMTIEFVTELSKKYKTRSEFQKNEKGAYEFARKNKILNNLYPISYPCKIRTDEELENLKNTALKYKTRKDFCRFDYAAYQRLRRLPNYRDKFMSHMILKRDSFPQRICQFILETLLNTECSYNDKVTLKNKELDIYFPKLKLAIEYDGIFWHKKTQQKDKLKDSLCKRKGISLIRIRENKVLKFDEYESFIKEFLIKNLDIINICSQANLIESQILNLKINNEFIFSKIYDLRDIINTISKCKTKSEFRNNYKKYYKALESRRLLHLIKENINNQNKN